MFDADMTSSQWKKDDEASQLALFIEAYERATGTTLEIQADNERPDFICQRSNGTIVGVELNKITRSPNDIQWQAIVKKLPYMDAGEAFDRLSDQLMTKEAKRGEPDWKLPDNTILVFELMDIPLAELEPLLYPGSLPDLDQVGFTEVWIADYSEIEAYGSVELYALQHPTLSGHQHINKYKKPWG